MVVGAGGAGDAGYGDVAHGRQFFFYAQAGIDGAGLYGDGPQTAPGTERGIDGDNAGVGMLSFYLMDFIMKIQSVDGFLYGAVYKDLFRFAARQMIPYQRTEAVSGHQFRTDAHKDQFPAACVCPAYLLCETAGKICCRGFLFWFDDAFLCFHT